MAQFSHPKVTKTFKAYNSPTFDPEKLKIKGMNYDHIVFGMGITKIQIQFQWEWLMAFQHFVIKNCWKLHYLMINFSPSVLSGSNLDLQEVIDMIGIPVLMKLENS